MYRKVVNGLRGEMTVRCRSEAPERVLNLCAAHDIPFWGVEWEDARCFCFCTTPGGLQRLHGVTAQAEAELEVLCRRGLPSLVCRLRRRYVLLTASALALLWLWCGSSVILSFSVSGNETVPQTQILRALERHGVTVGTRGRAIRQETLRNHVLLELDELSWLSVNVRGCTAHVQVVERERPPQLYDPLAAANVVAEKAGLVTQVRALNGVKCVAEGDTVTQGQLLISGVSDGRFGGVRFMHGCGEVWGRTWYTVSCRVPLTVLQQKGEASQRQRFSLIAGKKRINFYPGGSILGTGCDKITSYHPLRLPFGGTLPLSLCRETVSEYTLQAVRRSEEEALAEGKRALLSALTAQLDESGTVTDTRFTWRSRGDVLEVTLQAECFEQLGRECPVEYA